MSSFTTPLSFNGDARLFFFSFSPWIELLPCLKCRSIQDRKKTARNSFSSEYASLGRLTVLRNQSMAEKNANEDELAV